MVHNIVYPKVHNVMVHKVVYQMIRWFEKVFRLSSAFPDEFINVLNAIAETCRVQCVVMANQVFHHAELFKKFNRSTPSHFVTELVFFEAANAEFHFNTHASSG